MDEKKYLIGGTERSKRQLTREFTNPEEEEKVKADKEKEEKKVKLVTKVFFEF